MVSAGYRSTFKGRKMMVIVTYCLWRWGGKKTGQELARLALYACMHACFGLVSFQRVR